MSSSEAENPLPTWEQAVASVTGPGGPFALRDCEINGHTEKIFERAPESLRVLFASARLRGDADFLIYGDERWSFDRFIAEVDSMAAGLVENYGVGPGDRVAIGMRNFPEWVVSFAAITSVGGIAVCLNAWWTTDEMAYGLEDSGSKVLMADQARCARAEPVLDSLGVRAIVARADGDLPGACAHWEDARVEGASMPEVDVKAEDDAMILYTSGTTGHPKGAVSPHRAVMNALVAFAARATINALMAPAEEKEPHPYPVSFILAVPLFHVTGLVPVLMSCVAGGYKLVMMYKWNPEQALELIERERVTTFVGVPTMSWDLLESPDFARRDTSSLLSVGGGGAPAPPELVRRIDSGFRKGRPGLGYGMTETNAYGPQNSGDDYVRRPRSSGRVIPMMEIKVADEDGKAVPCGEIGEIFFKGPNLIRGYWNKPEATAETIVDGWLRSGDLGRLDEEGFIFVEDRAKDMVLRAGENVYSAEVEAVIYEHPDVYEAAVFGMPHPRLGEEVAVAIVPRQGVRFDVEALLAHLKEHLAGFKIPTVIEVFDEQLPRNASGKILKRQIRDELVEAREA